MHGRIGSELINLHLLMLMFKMISLCAYKPTTIFSS